MTSGDLADLIGQTKGDRSYAKLAQESGDVVIRQRWYQLATSPLKEFPEPPTIDAIARGLGVSVTDVVIACARSVGLKVRDAGTFAGLDLAGVPDEQAEAVRRLVSTLRIEPQETSDGTATSQAEVSSAETQSGPRTNAGTGGETQADYAKAAQANTPRTKANRARRAAEKNRIPDEHQGAGPEAGA